MNRVPMILNNAALPTSKSVTLVDMSVRKPGLLDFSARREIRDIERQKLAIICREEVAVFEVMAADYKQERITEIGLAAAERQSRRVSCLQQATMDSLQVTSQAFADRVEQTLRQDAANDERLRGQAAGGLVPAKCAADIADVRKQTNDRLRNLFDQTATTALEVTMQPMKYIASTIFGQKNK